MKKILLLLALIANIEFAHADITIGVDLSLTGPGAALGIPEEKATHWWPNTIGGQKVKFVILDDTSDPGIATKNAMRLISEDKVDIIIGSSLTPPSMSIVTVAGEKNVPVISLAGGDVIASPVTGPRKWAFKLTPTATICNEEVLNDMQKKNYKTVATISLANSFGDSFVKNLQTLVDAHGIKIVATEKYNATDISTMSQVIKVMESKPDAIYIMSAGTPAALPQIQLAERGYKGAVYFSQGATSNDFLRVGGPALEGVFVSTTPAMVGEQLPKNSPIRKVAMDFLKKSDASLGEENRSPFAATMWDALLIVDAAAKNAIKEADPGTPEFRTALRNSIEQLKNYVATEGVYSMSQDDHNGVDQRSQVLLKVVNGKWVYQH